MDVRAACQASPEVAANEDNFVASPGFVAVLDGVTSPAGLETGCIHGPSWYVRQLGTQLLGAHSAEPSASLPDILAAAIVAVRDEHSGTCDVEHPGTPQSTACLVKDNGDALEYLVLSDSPLVLDRNGDVTVVTDLRLRETSRQLREHALAGTAVLGSDDLAARIRALIASQRQRVNREGGYWIAAAAPEAARHGLTGSVPLSGGDRLRRAALLTDGASCAVDTFKLMDWPELLDGLEERGPAWLIGRVRAAERSDSDGRNQPRYKRHDDATAVLVTFEKEARDD